MGRRYVIDLSRRTPMSFRPRVLAEIELKKERSESAMRNWELAEGVPLMPDELHKEEGYL